MDRRPRPCCAHRLLSAVACCVALLLPLCLHSLPAPVSADLAHQSNQSEQQQEETSNSSRRQQQQRKGAGSRLPTSPSSKPWPRKYQSPKTPSSSANKRHKPNKKTIKGTRTTTNGKRTASKPTNGKAAGPTGTGRTKGNPTTSKQTVTAPRNQPSTKTAPAASRGKGTPKKPAGKNPATSNKPPSKGGKGQGKRTGTGTGTGTGAGTGTSKTSPPASRVATPPVKTRPPRPAKVPSRPPPSMRPPSQCDYSKGSWVPARVRYAYTETSCPFLWPLSTCQTNGRQDSNYLRWSWRPKQPGCKVLRFNRKKFLKRFAHSYIGIAGDSLSLNFQDTIKCLFHSVAPLKRVKPRLGGDIKTGYTVQGYNVTVLRLSSNFLVESRPMNLKPGERYNSASQWRVDLDRPHAMWYNVLNDLSLIVFNTGAWFTNAGRYRQYYVANTSIPAMKAVDAMRMALKTVRNSVLHANFRGIPVLMTYSPTHYSLPIVRKAAAAPPPSSVQTIDEESDSGDGSDGEVVGEDGSGVGSSSINDDETVVVQSASGPVVLTLEEDDDGSSGAGADGVASASSSTTGSVPSADAVPTNSTIIETHARRRSNRQRAFSRNCVGATRPLSKRQVTSLMKHGIDILNRDAQVSLFRLGIQPQSRWRVSSGLQRVPVESLKRFRMLDITQLSLVRPDAHTQRYISHTGKSRDCVHWCNPGLPNTWADLLYTIL